MSYAIKKPTGREANRGVFYSRDSGGKHEQTPRQYVLATVKRADDLKVKFTGTPDQIDGMVSTKTPYSGDLFFDYCVKGHLFSRPALDALKNLLQLDRTISHVFIPRRDRLARPANALEGVLLEIELRQFGVSLVYLNKGDELGPLPMGARMDFSEMLLGVVEFHESGEFCYQLAEKMIYTQIELAKRGYSTGGRPPFGFRRFLVREDGTIIRPLAEGEIIRQKGHHVVWLPGPPEEIELIRRILKMLETLPANAVAAQLTLEGIPSPDAGRKRTDNGVTHEVSGIWHQSTIINIARNPLIRALTSYGRRSMGDCRRLTQEGPREMTENDFRSDAKPKVIQNPESCRIVARAHGDAVVPPEQIENLTKILDQRAGTQRGKPRSRNPNMNPLGGRIFDANCGSLMYRISRKKIFYYSCSLYQQSHSQRCDHNQIDGMTSTRFALASLRQLLGRPQMRERLLAMLQERAKAHPNGRSTDEVALLKRRSEIGVLDQEIETVMRNLGLAKSKEIFEGLEGFVIELRAKRTKLETELQELEARDRRLSLPDDLVSRSLAKIDRLPQMVDDATNLASIGALFRQIDLQMYLRFQAVQKSKRTVNQLTGGVLTIGAVPAPIKKYSGPTDTQVLKQSMKNKAPGGDAGSKCSTNSNQKVKSSRNVNRDDRI